MKDGREICQNTPAGKRVYADRLYQRWEMDKGICCLCGLPVMLTDATVEHPDGRGIAGGRRDDRIESIRVAHYFGNAAKGSIHLKNYLLLPEEVRRKNCQPFQRS